MELANGQFDLNDDMCLSDHKDNLLSAPHTSPLHPHTPTRSRHRKENCCRQHFPSQFSLWKCFLCLAVVYVTTLLGVDLFQAQRNRDIRACAKQAASNNDNSPSEEAAAASAVSNEWCPQTALAWWTPDQLACVGGHSGWTNARRLTVTTWQRERTQVQCHEVTVNCGEHFLTTTCKGTWHTIRLTAARSNTPIDANQNSECQIAWAWTSRNETLAFSSLATAIWTS